MCFMFYISLVLAGDIASLYLCKDRIARMIECEKSEERELHE